MVETRRKNPIADCSVLRMFGYLNILCANAKKSANEWLYFLLDINIIDIELSLMYWLSRVSQIWIPVVYDKQRIKCETNKMRNVKKSMRRQCEKIIENSTLSTIHILLMLASKWAYHWLMQVEVTSILAFHSFSEYLASTSLFHTFFFSSAHPKHIINSSKCSFLFCLLHLPRSPSTLSLLTSCWSSVRPICTNTSWDFHLCWITKYVKRTTKCLM